MKSKYLKQQPDFTFRVKETKYIAEVGMDLWTILPSVAFVSLLVDENSYF